MTTKNTFATLSILVGLVGLVGCISEDAGADPFEGLDEDDVGAEAELESAGVGAATEYGCTLSTSTLGNSDGTARIVFNTVSNDQWAGFVDMAYEFNNNVRNGGGNNKVFLEYQVHENGSWRTIEHSKFSISGIGKHESGYREISQVYFTAGLSRRVKARASWDIRLSPDKSSTCYAYL